MVPIPAHVWEHIRRYSGVDLSLAGDSDDEIRTRVEAHVDERIERHAAIQDEDRLGLSRLLGSIPYGPADDPRDEQIARGVEYYAHRRDHQRQLSAAIARLDDGARESQIRGR